MAKKSKDEVPNPNSVANRDILQRLNFLYQASAYLSTMPNATASSSTQSAETRPQPPLPEYSSSIHPQRKAAKRKMGVGRKLGVEEIARAYVRQMKQIGQKTTVKMDPTVKRTFCQGCDSVLVPVVSAVVRVHTSSTHGHLVNTTCLRCKTSRRIPAPPIQEPDIYEPPDGHTMTMASSPAASSGRVQKKRRRGPRARAPPLFEREGHVVFRGNERLEAS
ncbi:RNase P [Heterobasidion irregulare TC 32-1]|uniref:RNase P n=1 Tax=Heterobasidion irregulare (strain TC 32-1) TaxID=747525 RepID=W4K3Y8_HETIT|nr:RNase P [Heterobasidion irregulare TC 32-1]ETW80454.1 RNase P [Heterobasidion irregulare TC 32-1]